jgi:hypothetical protein
MVARYNHDRSNEFDPTVIVGPNSFGQIY